jgi:hypothetical protein
MKLVTNEKNGKENNMGCDYNLVVIESIQLKQSFTIQNAITQK